MHKRLLILAILVQALLIAALVRQLWFLPSRASTQTQTHTQSQDRPERAQPGDDDRAQRPDDAGDATNTHAPRKAGADPATAAAPAPADDPLALLAHGTVRDQNGTPFADAHVWFMRGDTSLLALSGPSGSYLVPGVEVGAYTLRCRTDGGEEQEREVTVASTPARQRFDITLPRLHHVAVKARMPDGTPLIDELAGAGISYLEAGLYAIATTEALTETPLHPALHGSRHRGGLGKWRRLDANTTSGELLGHLLLQPAAARGCEIHLVYSNLVLQSARLEPGAREIMLAVALETVLAKRSRPRLRVIDVATRKPIEGARIALDPAGLRTRARTGSDGTAELPPCAPGLALLEIAAPGTAGHRAFVELAPGDHDLGDIPLSAPRTVRGRVIDGDGRGVRASIAWRDLGASRFPQPLETGSTSGTNENGELELKLGRSRYWLRATTRDRHTAIVHYDARVDPLPELVLTLQPTGLVTLKPAVAAAELVLLAIEDREGRLLWSELASASDPGYARLAAGTYTWIAYDHAHRELGRGPFTLSGAATEVHVLGR